ncbi:hypothetical protein EMCRGX_G003292 [Ephydatia muelleri]
MSASQDPVSELALHTTRGSAKYLTKPALQRPVTDDRPHTLDAVYVRQLGTMTFGEGARRKDANRGIELTDLVPLAVRCYRQNSDDDGYRESCSCHVIANSNMLYCPKSSVTLRVMQSGRSPQDVNERVHARMDFVKEVGTVDRHGMQ